MSEKQNANPPAPKIHQEFVNRYPDLGKAWELTAAAAKAGPLDEKAVRLLKLAVSMGAMREGAVHASVRKALALRITREEIEQTVAVAAGTVGLPSAVALYSWVRDVLDGTGKS